VHWDYYGEEMAGEQTREEVSARLEAIFSSALEGEDLQKALSSIDKRLDKFEGKWAGLIKWAEQKYGTPEDPEQDSEEAVEAIQEDSPGEMSREVAASKMESIFRSHLDGKELDKMIGSIDKRLDKFEGKWPKLVLWAEEKYGKADTSDPQEDSETPSTEPQKETSGVEQILELIISGDLERALHNLKNMISQDPSDSDAWVAFSTYYSSIGFPGRAKACEEKAESLA